ncbi:hypothetical protein A3H53_03715 [Candidatus Nomurabacteria bacterium RIFCSPLOWO2_02_FULL_40_10]|uniref:Uncharacterized protein n=2 Tax=Candidatus Nomuraibacteriota TaxID=1752729 RepID=A0A1F6XVS0_9BACT|nr:MAG: hypothetical protein A2642_00935 [Candidatus Nomurabacteria bacterium RIFCSPHIGHO2_01_FULL_39_10]OGI98221.1 MAG: hypothetical protein A3H53_03715 [Candidatus Nomurabacteria bacterium RIFCSPLOWO2_02_FULL_40_10]
MEPNFQTSFIPKKPMVEERDAPAHSISIFTIIAIFVLFAVILTTGGFYLWREKIKENITQKESELNLAKGRFEQKKIEKLQLLDKRLRASTEILSRHVSITPVFEALSALTMKTVRFNQFSYDLGTEKDAKVSIKMSGIAVGYRSVALQSDLFGTKDEGKSFIDPVFSNLKLDDKGNVLFDLEFLVDPGFVNYKQTILTKSSS